jgi:hypothetical protein
MLDIIRGFYDDLDGEDYGASQQGSLGQDDDYTIATNADAAHTMHRGYTEDLLGEPNGHGGMLVFEDQAQAQDVGVDLGVGGAEDDFSQAGALADREEERLRVLQDERNVIGDVMAVNPELRGNPELLELFGVDGEEGGEDEGEEEGDEEPASLADLPRKKRLRYLRQFLVKIHSFQISNPNSGMDDAASAAPAGNNILTGLLGGDGAPPPATSEFYTTVAREGRKEHASVSTQTDRPYTHKKSSIEALDEDYKEIAKTKEEAARRKLHRGVDSPGYSYNNVISVDGKGELWKR